MPRQARPSADSGQALQIAAPPKTDLLGGVTPDGSRRTLESLNAAMGELKAMAVQPFIQRAVAAIQAEDAQGAAEWALKALATDERNGFAWCLLGMARERAGDFVSSITAYESALQLLPEQAEIANDLGRLAMRMGMPQQAEGFFRHFLAHRPGHAEAANNLACALRVLGRRAEAIDVLRPAIQEAPANAMLWNSLAAVVAEDGDTGNAELFYAEALRLDPRFAKARYNLANLLADRGAVAEALPHVEKALKATKAEDERQMMLLARSTLLVALGRLAEGWDGYEARHHPQFADTLQFAVERPLWGPGMDIAGKSMLVIGEQGLGDEILFANVFPDLIERLGPEGRLTIAVEPRLVPLFARSFPQADVGAHVTIQHGGRSVRLLPFLEDASETDLWTPMGSLLREFRRSVAAYPDRPRFLTADPERVAHWRGVLEAAPAGKKVGLLWKSGTARGARHRYFSAFEQWAPVLRQSGIAFVNLQYGDCAEELALAKAEFGVEIWDPPGIDLKQDLDDVAALACALDLVAGFSNATFNIAAACGAPAWLITTPGAWPRLGCTDRYPWYPQAKVFAPETYGDWDTAMAQLADALGAWATA
ncbi:tetratricopeptide repeat protein [Phenylobacterium sp. VNQ135]|uniref:tetratricopeptide repeat protein n=1 Tax=Phenylobacterium sp. VNQ135 TaxID=3400922 RepID=UPI003C02BF52